MLLSDETEHVIYLRDSTKQTCSVDIISLTFTLSLNQQVHLGYFLELSSNYFMNHEKTRSLVPGL